jgi:putative phosphoesterase
MPAVPASDRRCHRPRLYPTVVIVSAGKLPFIGVVSDTHGYYDARLDGLFAGALHIVHAGDVGSGVIPRLRAVAPLTVVAGNTDLPGAAEAELPWEAEVEVAGRRILVCHIGRSLMGRHDPEAEGFDLVVSGHSHIAAVEWRGDTLFLNPGSAGRARFGRPRTCALVGLGARLEPSVVML